MEAQKPQPEDKFITPSSSTSKILALYKKRLQEEPEPEPEPEDEFITPTSSTSKILTLLKKRLRQEPESEDEFITPSSSTSKILSLLMKRLHEKPQSEDEFITPLSSTSKIPTLLKKPWQEEKQKNQTAKVLTLQESKSRLLKEVIKPDTTFIELEEDFQTAILSLSMHGSFKTPIPGNVRQLESKTEITYQTLDLSVCAEFLPLEGDDETKTALSSKNTIG